LVTSRWKKARRIVIAYVIVGTVGFLLYHFIFRITYPGNPLVIALFYFSLPAILASPFALCTVLEDELPRFVDRFRKRDDEIRNEGDSGDL
jgi:hypothetical protein